MGMMGSWTRLSPQQEDAYQAWRKKLSSNLQNEGDYDLRGAWLGNAAEAANGHLPDTYKLPNHMTFSDESRYSTKQNPGGHWSGDNNIWTFWASPENLNHHSASEMADYFRAYEPDSTLVLPDFGFDLRNLRR